MNLVKRIKTKMKRTNERLKNMQDKETSELKQFLLKLYEKKGYGYIETETYLKGKADGIEWVLREIKGNK